MARTVFSNDLPFVAQMQIDALFQRGDVTLTIAQRLSFVHIKELITHRHRRCSQSDSGSRQRVSGPISRDNGVRPTSILRDNNRQLCSRVRTSSISSPVSMCNSSFECKSTCKVGGMWRLRGKLSISSHFFRQIPPLQHWHHDR